MNGVRNVIMFSLFLFLSLSLSLSPSLIAKHNELFEPEHPLCCRLEAVGGYCLRWEAFRDVYIYICVYTHISISENPAPEVYHIQYVVFPNSATLRSVWKRKP